jgi:rubredoxin
VAAQSLDRSALRASLLNDGRLVGKTYGENVGKTMDKNVGKPWKHVEKTWKTPMEKRRKTGF